MIIYKVTNLINGKIYIGQTVQSIEKRRNAHITIALNRNSELYFHRALRKYGIDNFYWDVIDSADDQFELNEKEIYWIAFYSSFGKNGYNMTSGGEGVSGYRRPDEVTKKISETTIKNGSQKGENNPHSKLTESDVLEIKKLIKSGVIYKKIANQFNISLSKISSIKSGRTWSHVGDDLSEIPYSYTKLNENMVKEIKLLIKEGNLTQKEIAKKFGLSEERISRIKSGKAWGLVKIQ